MELASGFFSEAVYAEWPRTRGGDVQEHETKQNCRVAAIVYRSKYMAFGGHMSHEVGECHFAGANERGDPSEQAQNNKDAPDDFDKAGNARSEETTSELQSLKRTSYAYFCLKNTKI